MKAKRRVVTASGRPVGAKRTPTARRVRSAIVPAAPRQRVESVASSATARPAVAEVPAAEVDLRVDLGRGLVLPNPVLVASGTFGYLSLIHI